MLVKRRRGMLTAEQMERLSTSRLLVYLRSWYRCCETPNEDDTWKEKYGVQRSSLVKQDPEWQEHRDLIKSILARRDHIE